MPQEGGGGFPLIAATRTAGVPVIYVSVGFRKGYPEVSKNNTILASIKENGVFIAHCPESNTNLSSGIAPVRRYLDEQIPMGLGSDVAGGTTENLFAAMRHAIQASKLRWRLSDQGLKALTVEEVFYLASKGGGAFFGKVGSFEPGYEFDAVILDDTRLEHPQSLEVKQRLERVIYLGDEREVAGKYVAGRKIL